MRYAVEEGTVTNRNFSYRDILVEMIEELQSSHFGDEYLVALIVDQALEKIQSKER